VSGWKSFPHPKNKPVHADILKVKTPNVSCPTVTGLLPMILAMWVSTTAPIFAAAPLVTITAPTNGTVLAAPASFTMRTSVSGGGNNVSQIEFFAGTNSLGVDTSNPYRVDVTDLPAGAYTLSTILTDNIGDKSTNSVSIIVNELPGITITTPADGAGLIAPATFALEAAASDIDGSVTRVQFFRGTTSIGVATEPPYSVQVQKLGSGTYTFDAMASDNLGGTRRTSIDVLVKQRPAVSFTTPTGGARLTATTNLFMGKAGDSVGVAAVETSLNGGAFAPANGTTAWNTLLVLPPGTNVVRVRATDSFGHFSLANSRSFFQVVTSTLTLTIEGTGTVSGVIDGQGLEIARGYRLLARPGEGYVFSNWTGQVTGNLPALDFLMQSNMTVQANFVPNPFLRVGGTYNGLFFEATEVRHESSGDLRVRVTPSGKYSASVRLAGRRYSVSGQLDLEGKATNSVARTGTSSLTIRWAVNLQGLDEIAGTISDGTWLAELRGDRLLFNATTNRTSLAGRYTFVLPGSLASGTPNADGWGTLKVSFAGAATAAGSLADGTRFSRKAPHSKHGSWPLYVPLYKLSGSLIGWVQFDTNAPLDDMGGLVDWFKPSQPDAGFYPAGFTNQSTLTGSRYLAPTNSTEPVLNMTTGVVILTGGNLSQAWTNDVVLGAKNRVTNASPNQLSVSLSTGTGLFKGKFLDTNVLRTANFGGAVLQKSTNGFGYFLGTNQSGRVLLERVP
jgi:hypothetical protein